MLSDQLLISAHRLLAVQLTRFRKLKKSTRSEKSELKKYQGSPKSSFVKVSEVSLYIIRIILPFQICVQWYA